MRGVGWRKSSSQNVQGCEPGVSHRNHGPVATHGAVEGSLAYDDVQGWMQM